MRKLGSYLVILIFLTAYGRCVADQLGMLHMSGTSCCQTVCDNISDTCGQCPDTREEASRHTPQDSNHSDHHEDRQPPAPCQLCFILDSDSMLIEDGIKIPAPVFHDQSDSFRLATSVQNPLQNFRFYFDQEQVLQDHPDPLTGQAYLVLRFITRTTPVRGPSII